MASKSHHNDVIKVTKVNKDKAENYDFIHNGVAYAITKRMRPEKNISLDFDFENVVIDKYMLHLYCNSNDGKTKSESSNATPQIHTLLIIHPKRLPALETINY